MENRTMDSQAPALSQTVAGRDRAFLAGVELHRQGTHILEAEGVCHADGCTGDSLIPHNWVVSRISTLCYVHCYRKKDC